MPEITIPVSTPGPGGSAMPATLLTPGSESGAGIVLVQEIFGRSEYMRSRAEDLAALGYTVVLPQIFWRLGVDTIPEDSPEALQVAMGHVQDLDWEAAVADARAAVRWLRNDPATGGAVALVGFCFGGGLAYATLQEATGSERAAALVSYYGSALPGLVDGPGVTTPSLHHFGDADAFIDLEAVRHIRDIVTSNGAAFHLWAGANHAFDNPRLPGLHHPETSLEAWEITVAWLTEHHPPTHKGVAGTEQG